MKAMVREYNIMKEATPNDVVETFAAAKNLNSALKNILRKEVNHNEAFGRFTKSFRAAATHVTSKTAMRSFIEKHLGTHESFFLLVARYAHSEFIGKLVDQIVTAHGDEFNTTYVETEEGITLKNREKFISILKEVFKATEAALANAALPTSHFMKSVVYSSIFEPKVLTEVMKHC